jgi:hypothetical protein
MMLRSLPALLLASSLWAQFQPEPQQYPPPPAGNSQSGYPQYQPPAAAQQPGMNQDQGRDSAADQQHGVARIRIVQGDVDVKRGDNGQLTGAIMNAPLLSRDHLETAAGSRAEAELDADTVIRLAPDTDLAFANLAYQRAQVQLGIGTIIVRVLRDGQSQLEVDTPSVAFRPLSAGDYRISVFDNGTSQVTVRSGRLEMAGPRGSQTINAGQSSLVRGDASDPEFQNTGQPARDQFDDWSAGRDSELLSTRSQQYVPPGVSGAEDLDRYGNWVPSQYGQVWAPQAQPADWSPYSNGEWAYEDYYGWTWIGYEPWGWAPYHYGSWFWNTGVGWCWWPGPRVGIGFGFAWSPARVGFFGFGGGLGWIALAPYEVFHPWWGAGYHSFNSFRAYNVQQFYRNAAIRGGAMTASLSAFGGPGRRYSVASAGQLSAASLYRGGVPVSPNAGSYRFSDRQVSANPRVSQAASRTFFSRPQQFSAPHQSFAAPSSNGGWQRFGSPGAYSSQQRSAPSYPSRPSAAAESGWHSFGQSQPPRYSYSAPAAPRYSAPAAPRYSAPSYNNYRPPSAPRYNAPAAPRSKAPAAPQQHNSGGGGGGHSGGGGHHGR